jgi:hypothetical protein
MVPARRAGHFVLSQAIVRRRGVSDMNGDEGRQSSSLGDYQ